MNNNVRHRNRQLLSPGLPDESPSLAAFDDFSGGRRNSRLLSGSTWLLILLFYAIICCSVLYSDLIMFPDPVPVSLLGKSGIPREMEFSEERARRFVEELSSIGPKPTGSYENEVLAVEYLTKHLEYIKSQSRDLNKIEVDVQKSSGCFDMEFKDGMTSCYVDVKNVVAKIGPKKPTNTSILVNCHYDSVPPSPGASDDLVSCAIMLETLLSLSQSSTPLPNDVIFLFNGAEENLLQAAHGFITQHPWAKTVVGFVNMEACGSGGKQMLFQADLERTWLLQAYTDGAVYPQGSVMAQDIFQSGLVPSDTDYRIFDNFGKIPGLDFAYVKNGYVYHTNYDTPEAITVGAIQQAGINLLRLLHNALRSPDMKKVEQQSKTQFVFFDFMGLFMIVYRTSIATVINLLCAIFSLGDMFFKSKTSGVPFKRKMKFIGQAFLVLVFSLIVSSAFCMLIAFVLDLLDAAMSWYSSPFFVAPLYCCSSLAVLICVHSYFAALKNVSFSLKWVWEDAFFDAARLIWIGLLLLLEAYHINSSYICCAWVLFPTLVRGLIAHLFTLSGTKGNKKGHLFIHMLMQVVPVSILLYCSWSLYNFFIPVTGRIGASVNPDLLIAIITSVIMFLSTSYMFSLIHVVQLPSQRVAAALLAIFAIAFCLVTLTPMGYQYSGDPSSPSPMRLYILHTDRAFYNLQGERISQDSGYWMVPLDYNGPKMLERSIKGLKEAPPVDCDGELACGMPFMLPVISLFRTSYYVPAPKPIVHGDRQFKMVSKVLIDPYTYRLSFSVKGPDHITVIFSPCHNVELKKWSMTDNPLRSLDWKDRAAYFIYYSYAEYKEPWTFSLDLAVTKDYVKDSALIDLSYTTHYIHGHNLMTADFPKLLQKMPSWVHVTPWTCTLDMLVF